MIGGVPGGRSTNGVCFGLLSWRIVEGHVGDVDVGGLNAAITYSYDDDEAGSPWALRLHVDERGDEQQRAALEHLFLHGLTKLPWVRKLRHIVGVKASMIEIDGTHVRVGAAAAAHATRAVEDERPVRCGIPGYEREGRELYADELRVWDEMLSGNCAYAGEFDYESG